jgi:hypothetical protein
MACFRSLLSVQHALMRLAYFRLPVALFWLNNCLYLWLTQPYTTCYNLAKRAAAGICATFIFSLNSKQVSRFPA